VPLTTKVSLNVQAALSSPLDLVTASAPLVQNYLQNLANGVGAGQADRVFSDTRTLTASANEDLDLAGALLDATGGPFSVTRIKMLLVRAADANVNNVLVGGAAANGWATLLTPAATGQIILRPGALFLALAGSVVSGGAGDATGYVVTPGTGDLLRITNGGAGTSVNYDIIAIGCST
jgi:hypothetical protein